MKEDLLRNIALIRDTQAHCAASFEFVTREAERLLQEMEAIVNSCEACDTKGLAAERCKLVVGGEHEPNLWHCYGTPGCERKDQCDAALAEFDKADEAKQQAKPPKSVD